MDITTLNLHVCLLLDARCSDVPETTNRHHDLIKVTGSTLTEDICIKFPHDVSARLALKHESRLALHMVQIRESSLRYMSSNTQDRILRWGAPEERGVA